MAAREDLEWIDLADFSKGISTGYHSTTAEQPNPDGFARESETYGCVALPNGGLGPLPTITFTRDGGDPATGVEGQKWPTVADGYPADYDQRIAVLDAKVVSPVYNVPPLSDPAVDDDPVDLLTVRQWYMVNNAETRTDSYWRFRNHPVYTGDTSGGFSAWNLEALDERDTWNPDPTRWKYGWGSIMETRTQYQDAPDAVKQTVGPPVIVAGMGATLAYGVMDPEDEGVEIGGFATWPDYHEGNESNLAVASDAYKVLDGLALGAALPGIVFGHQGRLCSIGRLGGYNYHHLLTYHGDDNGRRATSELVAYWPPNDVYASQFQFATFLEEATTGYGTWHSVNANSLLLVKNKGGGVLVSGDINNPQVTRLPGLPSTGGLVSRGVVTDQGFVYGTDSGVWVWQGSDSATQLSANLRSDFWVPDDPTIARRQPDQLIGSFAFRYPYVFAPNNWVFDLRGGGWWRYHPTPDQDATNGCIFAYNETDAFGNLWAVVPSYVIDSRFFAKFDRETPASKFVWRSQPIARSRGRELDYRSIQIVASGTGRVRVEVKGLGGAWQRTDWNGESDEANGIQAALSVTGQDVEVRITSESSVVGGPAPIVHRVSLGYRPAQSIGAE